MIRPLRQHHRHIVAALSVVVPAAFAFGIATRKADLVSAAATPATADPTRRYTELWNRNDLWEPMTVRTRLLRDGAAANSLAIELTSRAPFVKPDVLVYWIPGERKIRDTLPDNAFLLGRLTQANSLPLNLPAETALRSGVLVLYSLADQEIMAVSKTFSAR